MKRSGFTLAELMITVMIIGILAAIAIPSYRQYVTRSKLAEAYSILGTMKTYQFTFFNSTAEDGSTHNEFYDIGHSNPHTLTEPLIFESNGVWDPFGYPVPVGSHVFFNYGGHAGKFDASGTEVNVSPITGQNFSLLEDTSPLLERDDSGPICNAGITPESLGVNPEANYDWTIISAVGDLNQDLGPTCTAVYMLVVASPLTERKPSSGPLVTLNAGD